MNSCESLRSILTKVAEGEASPEETLGFARHIPDCTSCRILFARERHLARMLDGLDDLIPVEEAFLEGVMRSLPSTPPPRVRKRNGLKLAGIGAVLIAGGAGLARFAAWGPDPLALVPRIGLARTQDFLEALASVGRFVWLILDRAGLGAAPDLLGLELHARIGIATLVPAAAVLVTLSTLFALVVRTRNLS